MHEAAAAEAIVRMACGALEAECGHGSEASRRLERITRISLVVGETAGYMRESLEFFVSAAARGGPAEGAALDIRYVRMRLRCGSCGLEYERAGFTFDCPSCGARGLLAGAGGEFYVDSVELDEASA